MHGATKMFVTKTDAICALSGIVNDLFHSSTEKKPTKQNYDRIVYG